MNYSRFFITILFSPFFFKACDSSRGESLPLGFCCGVGGLNYRHLNAGLHVTANAHLTALAFSALKVLSMKSLNLANI